MQGSGGVSQPTREAGQRSACIEDKQIARAEVFSQVVEPGVLDLACPTVDDHQPDFVARDSPAFGGLMRRQLRRQDKGKRC